MADLLRTSQDTVDAAQLERRKQAEGQEVAPVETDSGKSLEEQKREYDQAVAEAEAKAQADYEAAKSEYEQGKAEFESTHVKLSTGEYVSKEDYDQLPKYLQDELVKRGTEGFNRLITDKEELAKIQPSTPPAPPTVFKTTTGATVITGEYTGLPSSLGGTWGYTPETLAREKEIGGYLSYNVQQDGVIRTASPEEAKEITDEIVGKLTPEELTRYNNEITQIKAGVIISPTGSTGGTAIALSKPGITTEAIYAGMSTAEGGTWGKTPETLARQVSNMGTYIDYYVTDANGVRRLATKAEADALLAQSISNMTEADRQRYQAELQKIAQYGVDLAKWPEFAKKPDDYLVLPGKEPVAIKDIGITRAEATSIEEGKTTLEEVLATKEVQKPKQEAAFKETQNILLQEIAFNKEPATFLTTTGQPIEADKYKELEKTNSRIDELLAKKAAEEGKSAVDKIESFLSTGATGEQFLQKVLSFGQTKTENFDSDQVELDYLVARKKALENGEDLPLDLEAYKAMVFGKQTTAAELGMQFVPFEYLRPERMQQLEWWEAVVYPMLDVATVIPVVGLGAKGVATGLKGTQLASKIASLGGKQAITFAAKDAEVQLAKATAKTAAHREILLAAEKAAQEATDPLVKNVLEQSLKPAAKDVALAEKELSQIAKNTEELKKLAKIADTANDAEIAKQAKAYTVAQRVEQEAFTGARRISAPADIAQSAVIGRTTVANWDDLSPEQRAIGLTLAALPLGIPGKALNALENVLDPYKIPIKAVAPRTVRKLPSTPEGWKKFKPEGGRIYAEASGGTTRLIIDEAIGTPEQARKAVASLQRQTMEGAETATAEYGTTTITKKGTGFQQIAGRSAFSASPMGEIFKEGTGAYGKKTNLEKFLSESGVDVEIKAKPVEYVNPLTGATETIESKVITKEGVTITGKEGGEYLGTELYYKFSEKSAFGGTGKIKSGIIVGVPEVSALPKHLQQKKLKEMEEAAVKYFNEGKSPDQIVEGFKRYNQFMEFENVITGQSQQMRVKNLRSNLADNLKMNRGEYYTRTPNGRIELFQMYIEGGRMTPYTLKELYQLKGKALKNSLEDMFFGLTDAADRLKTGRLFDTEGFIKEAEIAKKFDDLDAGLKRGDYTPDEVARMKRETLDRIRRDSSPTMPRAEIRRLIQEEAARVSRKAPAREEVRRDILGNRIPAREEVRPREEARSEERVEARVVTPRVEPLRSEAERVESPRVEPVRAAEPRPPQPRVTAPRAETPRTAPPRIEPPRVPTKPPVKPPTKAGKEKRTVQDLTAAQLQGAIAWKQGWIYKLWYPPYGQADVINTKEPIPGVKYYSGAGSAAKSIVVKYGEIPPHIKRDMGIVDVDIFRSKEGGKPPSIKYKPDSKQKTAYSGIVTVKEE